MAFWNRNSTPFQLPSTYIQPMKAKRIRIAVVGATGVGKTSLITSFDPIMAQFGAAFVETHVSPSLTYIGNIGYSHTLHEYHIEGDDFRDICSFDAYILVYSNQPPNSDYSSAKNSLDTIKELSKTVIDRKQCMPFVVVENEIQKKPQKNNGQEFAASLAAPYYKVMLNKSSSKITLLVKSAILRGIDSHYRITVSIPKSYWGIPLGHTTYTKRPPLPPVEMPIVPNHTEMMFAEDLHTLLHDIYPDIVIKTVDGEVTGHRCILALRSPFLKDVIQRGQAGTDYRLGEYGGSEPYSTMEITMPPDMRIRQLKPVIEFIYTQELPGIPNEDLRVVGEIAEKLGQNDLAEKCFTDYLICCKTGLITHPPPPKPVPKFQYRQPRFATEDDWIRFNMEPQPQQIVVDEVKTEVPRNIVRQRCRVHLSSKDIPDAFALESDSSLHDLLVDPLFSDAWISVTDCEPIPVHSCILEARAPPLGAMLRYKGFKEGQTRHIVLPTATKPGLNALLHYIYTGTTERVTVELATELMQLGQMYMVDRDGHLKRVCEQLLQDQITSSNIVDMITFAKEMEAIHLLAKCWWHASYDMHSAAKAGINITDHAEWEQVESDHKEYLRILREYHIKASVSPYPIAPDNGEMYRYEAE